MSTQMNLRQTQDHLRAAIVDEYLATACGDSRQARRRFRSIKLHGLPDVNTMAERLPKPKITRQPDYDRLWARHVKLTVRKRKKTVKIEPIVTVKTVQEVTPVETVKKYTATDLGLEGRGWV